MPEYIFSILFLYMNLVRRNEREEKKRENIVCVMCLGTYNFTSYRGRLSANILSQLRFCTCILYVVTRE